MKKAKKNNYKTKNNSIFSSDNEMAKLILLIVIVAIAFAIFYVITLFVVKKDEKQTNTQPETTEATIQYQKILVSNILSQKETEYYVLAYKSDDKYLEAYKNNLTYYAMTKEDSVPYYYVELDNSLNKSFITEKSKLNVESAKDLRFSQTTLLRIKEGKIISTYEGKDNITGKLDRMSK